jgi:hypothetical protein
MPHVPEEGPPTTVARDDDHPLKKKVSVGRISLRDWQYEPSKVFRLLTGRDAERDELTGALVIKGSRHSRGGDNP